jgi:hypothetical protein
MSEHDKTAPREEQDSARRGGGHTSYVPYGPRYLTEAERAEQQQAAGYWTKTEYDANGDPVLRIDCTGRRVVYVREATGKRTFVIYSGY